MHQSLNTRPDWLHAAVDHATPDTIAMRMTSSSVTHGQGSAGANSSLDKPRLLQTSSSRPCDIPYTIDAVVAVATATTATATVSLPVLIDLGAIVLIHCLNPLGCPSRCFSMQGKGSFSAPSSEVDREEGGSETLAR